MGVPCWIQFSDSCLSTRRSFFKITDRGRSILAEGVSKIDAKFLRRFEEFNVFAAGKPGQATDEVVPALEDKAASSSTPDELLRATIREVESASRRRSLFEYANLHVRP